MTDFTPERIAAAREKGRADVTWARTAVSGLLALDRLVAFERAEAAVVVCRNSRADGAWNGTACATCELALSAAIIEVLPPARAYMPWDKPICKRCMCEVHEAREALQGLIEGGKDARTPGSDATGTEGDDN